MPEAEPQTATKDHWSEPYWAHHRNSLFLSSALLFVSLPHDGSKLYDFIGGDNDGALPLTLLGLSVASSYALVALYLEWRKGPRRMLRFLDTDAAELKEQIDKAVVKSEAAEAKITLLFENLEKQVQTMPSGHVYELNRLQSLDELREYVGRMGPQRGPRREDESYSLMKLIPTVQIPTDIFGQDTPISITDQMEIARKQEKATEAAFPVFRERLTEVVSREFNAVFDTLLASGLVRPHDISASIKAEFEALNTALVESPRLTDRTGVDTARSRKRLTRETFEGRLDALGIGIVVPVIVWTFAIAHCAGRFGFGFESSIIISILNVLQTGT